MNAVEIKIFGAVTITLWCLLATLYVKKDFRKAHWKYAVLMLLAACTIAAGTMAYIEWNLE